MKTIIERVEIENQEKVLKKAAMLLQRGGLVAFPTETVYGLGGDALREEAAQKIYAAKGRPSDNPLIVHIADSKDLSVIAKTVPETAKKLADKFWPGPLTMILPKSEKVPLGTTGGLETVAVRMPNHPIALGLIKASGVYIAAPSANLSGRPSPTKAEHVIEDLNGKIDMILDGGKVGIGLESTIVDLTEEVPMILRPGYITKTMLEKVIGEVKIDPTILSKNQISQFKPKAPGMKYKHYAPKADLTIYEGTIENVVSAINQQAAEQESKGVSVGIIGTEETVHLYHGGIVKSIGSRENEESIASGLYEILREFDGLEVSYIYAESFQTQELGQAIMNRLLKAAGYNIVKV